MFSNVTPMMPILRKTFLSGSAYIERSRRVREQSRTNTQALTPNLLTLPARGGTSEMSAARILRDAGIVRGPGGLASPQALMPCSPGICQRMALVGLAFLIVIFVLINNPTIALAMDPAEKSNLDLSLRLGQPGVEDQKAYPVNYLSF